MGTKGKRKFSSGKNHSRLGSCKRRKSSGKKSKGVGSRNKKSGLGSSLSKVLQSNSVINFLGNRESRIQNKIK